LFFPAYIRLFSGIWSGMMQMRYIRVEVKSPQFWLILAKGAFSDLTGFGFPAKTCE
jgi:hypothetical protein